MGSHIRPMPSISNAVMPLQMRDLEVENPGATGILWPRTSLRLGAPHEDDPIAFGEATR